MEGGWRAPPPRAEGGARGTAWRAAARLRLVDGVGVQGEQRGEQHEQPLHRDEVHHVERVDVLHAERRVVVALPLAARGGAVLVRVGAVAVGQDDQHDDEEDDDQPRRPLDLHHLDDVRPQRALEVLDERELLDVLPRARRRVGASLTARAPTGRRSYGASPRVMGGRTPAAGARA